MTVNLALDEDDKGLPLTNRHVFKQSVEETQSPIPSIKSKKFRKSKLSLEDKRISGKLSIFQKICFAVGGLPYQMTSNCLGLFIPTFLLEIAGLRPKDLSIILLYGKIWDAFTDPLIGYVVSKTNTKFGKLRPWILFSAPLAVLTYMMIWYVPDINKSDKLYWYLSFYCLFQTFLSCLHVPYTSLTMYLTHNQRERDSATGYRMGLEVTGVFMAAFIQGIMITIYGKKYNYCNDGLNSTLTDPLSSNKTISIDNLFNSTLLHDSPEPSYNKLAEGYMVSAGIMGFLISYAVLLLFLEQKKLKT